MKTHYRKNSFLPVTAALALLVNHATAVTGTWNVDANGLWSLDTNWASSVIADDLLSTANFTNNITADRTVSLDSDRTINRVNFSDSDILSAGSWILDNNGTATNNLILSGTTGAASGTVPVIDVLAGKTATISAVIEGTYGFNKTSSGTLILTGNNTLSGSVSIFNGGKLIAGHNNAFGTATVTINNSGSTLELADGITLNNAITIAAQGNAKGIRSGSAAITGNITLSEEVVGNAEIRVSAGGTLTLSGNISGNGFEKLDPGIIILTGTNTYTGGTQVNGGIVDFANKAAKSSGTATAGASGIVGLGVKASDAAYYSATDVGNLFNGTLTGFSLNAASGVAIDTTNAGADFDQTVALTAARALTKLGTGTLILSQTNTYTGATNVNSGALIVNGNISSSLLTTVASGATLGGSGTLGKTVINGTLAIGNSPGTMTFIDTLGLNGSNVMEIDGISGAGVVGGHDFINLTGIGSAGVLTYGGTMTLDMGVVFAVGSYSWNLFDMASETGTFTTITLTDQYSGNLLDTDLNGTWDLSSGNNTWQFTESSGALSLTVIPEPDVAALIGGLGILLLLRRCRA